MAVFINLKQFCERYDLSNRAGLAIIHSHQIPALNMATAGAKSGKPRWRIRVSDLEAFEASRTTKPAAKPEPRKVSRKPAAGTIQFFRNGKRVTS